MDIELMKFGKFLLKELNISPKMDWEETVRRFHTQHLRTKRGIHSINQHVAWFFDQDPLDIKTSKYKKPIITIPRHVAMYFGFVMYDLKVKEIADFYNCGTSNVSISCKNISNLLDTDHNFAKQIESLKILIL